MSACGRLKVFQTGDRKFCGPWTRCSGKHVRDLYPLKHGDEIIGDFGNEPTPIPISDLDLLRLLAGKLSPDVFGLLHNLPAADIRLRFIRSKRGAQQKRLWNCEAQSLRGLEVDDQFELGGLFDRDVLWVPAL